MYQIYMPRLGRCGKNISNKTFTNLSPMISRRTLRGIATATEIPKFTLRDALQLGCIQRVQNVLKPALTEEKKDRRYNGDCNRLLVALFCSMECIVLYIWTRNRLLLKKTVTFYLVDGEEELVRSAK